MAGRGLGFDAPAGYADGYGYGFDEVTEYNSNAYSSNAQLPRQRSSGSPSNNGLSSRVSSVSDLNNLPMPAAPTDGYFTAQQYQARQRGNSDGFAVSPPSRPISQFEPFQPNRSSSTPNAYTVSPQSRPVSQFEPLRSNSTPNGYTISPPSRPTSQFEPPQFEPYRRYSCGPPELEEVDISHVGLSMTESPMHDESAFNLPPASHSPSSGSRTPSEGSGSSRSISWNPLAGLNRYQPVGTATPPTPPAAAGRGLSTRQKWAKSFRKERSMSYHQPIAEEVGDEIELLQAAALPAAYDNDTGSRPPNDRTDSVVDLSSFSYAGPGGYGGYGQEPAALQLTTSQLIASSPVDVHRMLTRRGTRMGRKPTVKSLAQQLAQREADKSGKAIQIIEEEAVNIDIGDGYVPESNAVSSLRRAGPLVVYPTANWKPVTMRWPYLTFLILVSATLAGCQEILYQRASKLDEKGDPVGLMKFTDPAGMNLFDFFTTKYLGSIVTVAYGVLWQLTDIEIKRLEPYYQLSKPRGALAAESINVDYTTLFDIFRPFTALYYRHWAVVVSSIATVLSVIVIPVLQSASQELSPKRGAPDLERTIVFENAWSRASTIALLFVSLLALILLCILQSRKSGLTADVKGVAGLAAILMRSHIHAEFRDLDTVPPKDIHNKLALRRYILRNSAFIPYEEMEKKRQVIKLTNAEKKTYDAFKLDNKPHPFMMRLGSCYTLQAILTTFLLLIPVLLFTPASDLSEKLPWLTTAIAVGLKFVMQTLEQDMRMMEPWYVLWKRDAPPSTLTLDYAGMAFGYMPMRALLEGHYLLASLGFGSLLLEVLTVCVSSLGTVSGQAFVKTYRDNTLGRGQETPLSFWLSLGIFVGIMFYLMGTTAFVMVLRHRPFMPRQPSTIASVLAYIHQSRMMEDFNPKNAEDGRTVEESNEKLVKRLEREGKLYGFGWSIGLDKKRHVCVDENPVEEYTFGANHDRRKATMDTVEDVTMF